ncbi:MAG: Abi family protein [Bacteroidales bacterium]|nr:Abi family protein [Bacteroidales bacterium]
MKYDYKKTNITNYITSLYHEGFKKSEKYQFDELAGLISDIGIFNFKGYAKAFRTNVSNHSIDDILALYNADGVVSSNMFALSSKVEVKLKSYIIESAYELVDNPFFYLLKESYIEDFTINDESIYDWEVKPSNPKLKSEIYLHYRDYYLAKYDFETNKQAYLLGKELIELNRARDINYPPFHYFVENMTLGALIKMISKMKIDDQSFLKIVANKFSMYDANVFLNYLLRLKELRNRCAHNGRIFNRNYRGVKAFGKHREFRKTIYEHKLIDVYYSLWLLLESGNRFYTIDELIEQFKYDNFSDCDENTMNFMINIMKTR